MTLYYGIDPILPVPLSEPLVNESRHVHRFNYGTSLIPDATLAAFEVPSPDRLAGTVRRRERLLPALLASAFLVSVRDRVRASNAALPCTGSAIRTS